MSSSATNSKGESKRPIRKKKRVKGAIAKFALQPLQKLSDDFIKIFNSIQKKNNLQNRDDLITDDELNQATNDNDILSVLEQLTKGPCYFTIKTFFFRPSQN